MPLSSNIGTLIKIPFYSAYQGIIEFKFRNFGKRRNRPEDEINIEGEVVVITGASRGIGKASAMEFAERKAIVVLGVYDMKEGLEAVDEIKNKTGNTNLTAIYLDLTDLDNVEKFAVEVATKYPKIKILLNNAGLGGCCGNFSQQKTKDGFNNHVAVNHLGHFLLTNLLLENLKRAGGARVVAMSSFIQLFSKLNLEDIMMEKSGPGILNELPYANTKFANALFIKELGERMRDSGITTYALCPGVVNTQIWDSVPRTGIRKYLVMYINRFHGFTPEEAASESIMYCALNKKISSETGIMYKYRKHLAFTNRRLKPNIREKLWNLSATLVNLEEHLKSFQTQVV